MELLPQLAEPVVVSGRVAAKIMLDLTAYLSGPTERELDHLIHIFDQVCPADRPLKYKIAELEYWPAVASPHLTASGRAAAADGAALPFLEPVRRRIRESRSFEIQFWDGRPIDDSNGSWSFSCRRIHLRSTGLHAFVRILFPLSTDFEILRRVAGAIADRVDFFSGHGGLVFVYDPWLKEVAFDAIYARGRRFWGVDIEDLNATLPLMKTGIKGVNWITLLGLDWSSNEAIDVALSRLAGDETITMERRQTGTVLTLGSAPVAGDQNRPDGRLDPYYAVAKALEPLFVTEHPDFSGRRFHDFGNTLGWIRRFLDPTGWR